jgi:hypothetical protein
MNCEDFRRRAVEVTRYQTEILARDEELTQHVPTCETCKGFLELQIALRGAFRDIAAAPLTAELEKTESTLLGEFDRAFGKEHSTDRMRPSLRYGAVVACVLLVVMALLLVHRPVASPPGAPVDIAESQEPFIAVPYVIPPTPYERTEVVRMQVSFVALNALGFQVHEPDMTGSLLADVLCGQDGRVLAVRLTHDSDLASDRRVD